MIDVTLSGFDVEAVWEGACRILERIGLEVPGEKLRSRVARSFPAKNGRVCIPRDVLEHHAEEIRSGAPKPAGRGADDRLVMSNNPFCSHYLDPADGKVKPFDMDSLIRHTRLACSLSDGNALYGQVAGYPPREPPRLQFLISYFVNCCHNRSAGPHPLVTDEQVLKYYLEIASVMGHQTFVGAEPISPLRFAGDSVHLAAEHGREISIGVDPMPIMGITAPLNWHAAWAQSVAENLGSYVLLRACGCQKVEAPTFRLFLPNMATGAIYFSSPQHIFAMLARRKVRAFFNLTLDWGEFMLVTSKQADAQAATEKTVGCVLAKVFDFRFLEGAGNLSMDEIFSPQQLLIDIEIRNYVSGLPAKLDDARDDIVAMVGEGVNAGNFMQCEPTLGRFREFTWPRGLFDFARLGGWDGKNLLDKAARRAEEKLAGYDYELAGETREALERIMARARKELSA